MKATLTREFYIPETYKLHSEKQGVYAAHISADGFRAMFFIGKQSKPAWHYRFPSRDQAEARIVKAISDLASYNAHKAERKAANKPKTSKGVIAVGDIFYNSWGYNMTIVDFYKVKRLTPKGAEVVGLTQTEESTGYLSGTTMPGTEETSRHGIMRLHVNGDSISLTGSLRNLYGTNPNDKRSGVYLSKWDGRPMHFNHCD